MLAEWHDQAIGRPGLKILAVASVTLTLLYHFRLRALERAGQALSDMIARGR